MQARIIALLLLVATLWSLISIQDLDPTFVPDATARPLVQDGPVRGDSLRPVQLDDRVWTVQAEIPADLPDVLSDLRGAGPAVMLGARLLRERWLAPPIPFLDGPRRPPRGAAVA